MKSFLQSMPARPTCGVEARPVGSKLKAKPKERSPKHKDSDHVCSENVQRWRDRIKLFLTDCLTDGIKSGEFIDLPVQETVNLLITLLNGLIRQQVRKMDNLKGVKDAAVAFCRRSLVKQ